MALSNEKILDAIAEMSGSEEKLKSVLETRGEGEEDKVKQRVKAYLSEVVINKFR